MKNVVCHFRDCKALLVKSPFHERSATASTGLYLYRTFTKMNHPSHDSVSVVRTTFKVHGKRQTLTLSQPKTPEPIITKFE